MINRFVTTVCGVSTAVLGLGLSAVHPGAAAQVYPVKPLQWIVPFAPGGGTDFSARVIGAKLTEVLGQQVIIQNVTGASGNIGAERVARSSPDGYTLLLGSSPNAVAMSLFSKVTYDFVKDFVAVASIGSNAQILVVNPVVPATTARELINIARTRPGILTYGSAGAGAASHLGGELLGMKEKVKLVHVPYKGVSLAVIGVLGGEVDMAFATLSSVKPHMALKRLKPIAVAGPKRSVIAPEVPTFDEEGIKDFYLSTWYGVHVARGTSPDIVRRLNAEINKILRTPEMEKRMLEQGIELNPGTPEEYARHVESEVTKWGQVIRTAKLVQ